jgi:hypothetical protein
MAYEIQLKSSGPEVVDADGYVQEGVLTTFFQGRDGRAVLDSWARRIASYRTADIICIRWAAPPEGAEGEVGAAMITQLRAS